MNKISIKILMVLLLSQNFLFAKHKLYINVLDIENTRSFEEFYSTKLKDRFKYKDLFVAFDGKTMQYITSIEFDRDDVKEYRNKRIFINKFEKGLLRRYEKKIDSNFDIFLQEGLLNNEKNDFSRQLKVVSHIVEATKNEYDVNVMFFGNTYMHNAYKHDFSQGVPTDGFIYMDNSEFNTFSDIDGSSVKFSIFFDDEPNMNKNRFFRFYKKLFQKKFKYDLITFNDSTTFGAEKNLKYDNKDFKKSLIKIMKEKKKSDCAEHDKVYANYLDKKAKIKVDITNICRKDSLISFYHNGIRKQIILDKNGYGSIEFNAIIGQNFIDYYNLNGDKQRIYNEKIDSSSSDIEFNKDSATRTVTIEGYNPLRGEGSQVKIYYKTTGAYIYIDVKNGHYETTVPLKYGDNIFEWKDLNGIKHSKNIPLDERCTDKVDINSTQAQEYGIATIQLKNECREDGSPVKFFYNDHNYTSMIEKGKTKITIILNKDINDIFYENFNNKKIKKLATIKIRDFDDLIRFIISYKDNVFVAMNIFEPSTHVDTRKSIMSVDYENVSGYKAGHIHIKNPVSKVGQMIVADMPTPEDYLSPNYIKSYKQIYITRISKLTKGTLAFYVDYFSRHGIYFGQEPLCGNRSLGGVVIDYEILNKGSLEISKKFLNPSRCIKDIENGSLKPKKEDSEMILIKKVDLK